MAHRGLGDEIRQHRRLSALERLTLEAINRGEADRAERLARTHCERAGHHITTQLSRHVPRQPERTAS